MPVESIISFPLGEFKMDEGSAKYCGNPVRTFAWWICVLTDVAPKDSIASLCNSDILCL
jgi:diaminopimelate epimerase